MTTRSPVIIRRDTLPSTADCADCDRLPVAATRSRARLHAREHGHVVTYTVRDVTIYTPGGRG